MKLKSNLKVVMTSGEKLPRHGKCTNVKLLLQGIFPIFVDFYILPLEDMIKWETQRLRTLG